MRVSEASSAEFGVVGSMRAGVLEQKFLLTRQDDSPNNYLLNEGRTGTGGWTTPRHRHNFDQIRYIIKGTYPYAKGKSMPEGWVGYFPESVHYGPQDRPEGLEMLTCQFGGASGRLPECRRGKRRTKCSSRRANSRTASSPGSTAWQAPQPGRLRGVLRRGHGTEAELREAALRGPGPDGPLSFEWVPEAPRGSSPNRWGVYRAQDASWVHPARSRRHVCRGRESSIELLFLSKGTVSIDGREYGPMRRSSSWPTRGHPFRGGDGVRIPSPRPAAVLSGR